MKIYFVSGHLDLTEEEFDLRYVPKLAKAIEVGGSFVVGDARGCDAMAQQWLGARNVYAVVYHMFERPRNLYGNPLLMGGYQTDEERDAAMTRASDHDIAWIRPGRWTSGTARNIARRIYTRNGGEFNCGSGDEYCKSKTKACALHCAIEYQALFG